MKKFNPMCGAGAIPRPAPYENTCACKPDKITLRTVVIPASLGGSAEGSSYAPKPGAYYNTVVLYQADGAVYIYDSNGVYTEVHDPIGPDLQTQIDTLVTQMKELYQPAQEVATVPDLEALNALSATDYPNGAMVRVTTDANHNDQHSLYYWNPATASWEYAFEATPYYTREYLDTALDELTDQLEQEANTRSEADTALSAQIETETQTRTEAVENLTAELSAETTARENADVNIQQQIDAIVDSTDVKDVVGTYAELEAYDKSTLGDNDIIKVLDDSEHEGAISYYRYNKTANDFTYIGSVGPYYTKAEADALLNDKQNELVSGTNIKSINGASILGAGNLTINELTSAQSTKLNGLANIKTIGENLELDANGRLSATGGGGSNNEITLPNSYTLSDFEVLGTTYKEYTLYIDLGQTITEGTQIEFTVSNASPNGGSNYMQWGITTHNNNAGNRVLMASTTLTNRIYDATVSTEGGGGYLTGSEHYIYIVLNPAQNTSMLSITVNGIKATLPTFSPAPYVLGSTDINNLTFSSSRTGTTATYNVPVFNGRTGETTSQSLLTIYNASVNSAGLLTSTLFSKLNSMPAIKTIGSGLNLATDGTLTASGGSSSGGSQIISLGQIQGEMGSGYSYVASVNGYNTNTTLSFPLSATIPTTTQHIVIQYLINGEYDPSDGCAFTIGLSSTTSGIEAMNFNFNAQSYGNNGSANSSGMIPFSCSYGFANGSYDTLSSGLKYLVISKSSTAKNYNVYSITPIITVIE